MKKVLFLNLYDDPVTGGGVEMTLHHLTQGLRQRGIEPVMLSTTDESGLHQTERKGIRIWRVGLRNVYWPDMQTQPHSALRVLWHTIDSYNVAMQPALRRVLEIECPDVVSIHNLPGWSVAAWGTVADMGFPSVQVLHDSYAICPKATMYTQSGNCTGQCLCCRLLRLPHRRLSNTVSAVVGVSRFILDRHLDQGYFRDVPIQRVIHNARDRGELGLDTAAAREPGDHLRFGFIGKLDPAKGVEYLLESWLAAAIPDTELWIAGSGNMDYEEYLYTRYASERIRFLGRIAPSDFYPHVDIVIVPSLWHEPLGMVVAEALAFGKPVIGARRGGIAEMIRDDENGFLFEPSRKNELVLAIQKISSNKQLRERLSCSARMTAQPFIDHREWVTKYVSLYYEIGG